MSIKKLAGQTLWYGLPSIATRFIGYILNFSLIFIYHAADTADLTQIYAIFPFLNILFTYGVETSYFRFVQNNAKEKIYNTLTVSIIISTIIFTGLLFLAQGPLVKATAMQAHPEYLFYMLFIVFFDTLTTLPFAKLRQEEKPKRYAFIKLVGIIINVLVVFWFIGVCPSIAKSNPNSFLLMGYNTNIGIGYYLIGNIVGSILTCILLLPQWKSFQWQWDKKLWTEIIIYSLPLIFVGLGGMINDMLSRLVFQHVTPLAEPQAKHELGVFAANYRLAVLITIFIQMFRMAAEPFFFNQSKNKNAPETYAKVMNYFVIACSFMFLFVGLYLDVFKQIMTLKYKEFGEGIQIVPILAMGGVFLGIYYNMSIWYKLTNKNWYGAAITVAGAIITIVLNIVLIPKFGYIGCAWATFVCYLFMMIVSYILGQKYYPIPYDVKRIAFYIFFIIALTLLSMFINSFIASIWIKILISTFLLVAYTMVIIIKDKADFIDLPVVGKYLR